MKIASVPVLAIALIGVGCSSGELDAKKAEETLASNMKKEDWPVRSVSCPKHQKLKKGASFDCKVTFENEDTWDLPVTQTSRDGAIEWKLPRSIASKKLEEALAEKAKATEVACPKRVFFAKKGDEVVCSGKREGKSTGLKVTFKDEDGAYHWEAVAQN